MLQECNDRSVEDFFNSFSLFGDQEEILELRKFPISTDTP